MKMSAKGTMVSFLFIVLAMGLSNNAIAQCNGFTKKKCIPMLAPYIHNGQLNSTTLMPGENAELLMSFYSGQEYRLLIAGQEILGNIQFKVMDSDHKVLFDNKEHNNVKFWDFNVKSTQQLIVDVIVPEQKIDNSLVQSGCVAVLVGFKK
jgi:hypothetical protein